MDIQKEIKELEKSSVALTLTVKKEETKGRYDEALKKYAKEISIPGFRKGKAPVTILEQKYGDAIKGEVLSQLINDSLESAFENMDRYERPLPYAQAELEEEPSLDFDKDLCFTVKYDVFPKIEFKKLDGYTLEVPELSGEDEAIDVYLKEYQERNSFVIDKKTNAVAEKGDVVTIDYKVIDEAGEVLEDEERKDFAFTLGSQLSLYEFDDQIIGMKRGEQKKASKSYPEDHENKDLAGKTRNFLITLKELKFKDVPPIDDDLAQDVSEKYKTLDDLKKDIKEKIDNSLEENLFSVKKKSYLEQVIEENDFEIPESMYEVDFEMYWRNMAQQFGMTPEKLEETFAGNPEFSKENLMKKNREQSTFSLKSRVIIETLVEKDKIEVSSEEIEKFYEDIANNVGATIEDVKKVYGTPNYTESIKEQIAEKKLLKDLFEKCTEKKGEKTTIVEFLNLKKQATEME